MYVLCPYKIVQKPTIENVKNLLGEYGYLIGEKEIEREDKPTIILKRWAEENPGFEIISKSDRQITIAIIRIYIQYIERNPKTEFDKKSKRTEKVWEEEKLSRIFTLWIPLGIGDYNFMLSIGKIEEEDVQKLISKILGTQEDVQVVSYEEFDFKKVRSEFPNGWMHGCDKRPGTIESGTLYGDFNFEEVTELSDFMREDGTETKQEGIILTTSLGQRVRKIRVLREGKFQIMGIPKEQFVNQNYRGNVMKECFEIASELLEKAKKQ